MEGTEGEGEWKRRGIGSSRFDGKRWSRKYTLDIHDVMTVEMKESKCKSVLF